MSSIVLGVSGGVAAYKAAFVLRAFTEAGHDVRVVPTPGALHFVGAATFEALSGNPVPTDVFSDVPSVAHVRTGSARRPRRSRPGHRGSAGQGGPPGASRTTCSPRPCWSPRAFPVLMVPAMHTEMWTPPGDAGQRRHPPASRRRRPAAGGRPADRPRLRPGPAARAGRHRCTRHLSCFSTAPDALGAGPDRAPGGHQRRRHPRAAGPGALPRQPVFGQAGLGPRPGRGRAGRRRGPGRCQRRGCRRRSGCGWWEVGDGGRARDGDAGGGAGLRRRRDGRRGGRLPPGGRRRRRS